MPPKIRPFHFDTDVFAGEAAEIQCSANGDTPMKINWTFQGFSTSAHSMKGVEITKTSGKSSVLSIPLLSAENSGNYTVYCNFKYKFKKDCERSICICAYSVM